MTRTVGINTEAIRSRSLHLTEIPPEGQEYIDALDASAADVPDLLAEIRRLAADNVRLHGRLPDDVLVEPEPTEPEGS